MDNNVYKTEVRKFMILAITWLIIGFLLLEVIPLVPAKEFPIYTPKLLSYLQDDSYMLKYRKDRENYIYLPDVFIEGEDNYADNQTVVYDSSIDHVLVTTGDYVTVDKNGNTVIMKGTARISLARAFGTYSPTNQGSIKTAYSLPPLFLVLICALFFLPLIFLHKKTLAKQSKYTEALSANNNIEALRENHRSLRSFRSTLLIIGISLFAVYIILMLIALFGYDFINKDTLIYRDFLFGKIYPIYENTYQLSNGVTVHEVTSHLHSPDLGGWFTGTLYDIFYRVPVLGIDMNAYVEMIGSVASLVLFGTLFLYPAVLFGALAKCTKRGIEQYNMLSSNRRS